MYEARHGGSRMIFARVLSTDSTVYPQVSLETFPAGRLVVHCTKEQYELATLFQGKVVNCYIEPAGYGMHLRSICLAENVEEAVRLVKGSPNVNWSACARLFKLSDAILSYLRSNSARVGALDPTPEGGYKT